MVGTSTKCSRYDAIKGLFKDKSFQNAGPSAQGTGYLCVEKWWGQMVPDDNIF